MNSFSKWMNSRQKLEFYGGSAGNVSGVDGPDGGDEKRNDMAEELPGAFPTYTLSSKKPARHLKKIVFPRKDCNCK